MSVNARDLWHPYGSRTTKPKNEKEWLNRDDEDHFVYIMAHIDDDGCLSAPTKIGISKHPKKRLKQIRREEEGTIVLVSTYTFWKREHAERVEKAFHKACAVHCERGEWFDINPGDAVGIMSINLQSFADNVIGFDETADWYFAYDHLGVPGFCYDKLPEDFFGDKPGGDN